VAAATTTGAEAARPSTSNAHRLREQLLATVTTNGWITLAVGIFSMLLGLAGSYLEVFVFGCSMLLMIVSAAVWRVTSPEVAASRVITPASGRIHEGEQALVNLTITNVGQRHSTPMVVEDRFGASTIQVRVDALAPAGSADLSYSLTRLKRGKYGLGPLERAHTDPLRMLGLGRRRSGSEDLYVLPQIHPIEVLPTGRARDLEGVRSNKASLGGVAFHSLRDYVPGDDLRLIHWRSSARTGRRVVRNNVIANQPRFSILLDTSARSYRHSDEFDAAARVTASWISAGKNAGHEMVLRTTAGAMVEIDGSGTGLTEAMNALAEAKLTENDAGLAVLANTIENRTIPVALGIVTSEPPPDHANLILQTIGRFESVSVAQLTENPEASELPIPGALVVVAGSSEQFVSAWKKRVR